MFYAKKKLQVEAERIGGATRGSGKWYWSLPAVKSASMDATAVKSATVEDVAPLTDNPANIADFPGSTIKSATLGTVAPLIPDLLWRDPEEQAETFDL